MKVERETELINEQVLLAMAEMGFDRERTLQVITHTHLLTDTCTQTHTKHIHSLAHRYTQTEAQC